MLLFVLMVTFVGPHSDTYAGDRCSVVAGTEINVPGHSDRPAYLQPSKDSTAPLVVMLHGRNGCVGSFQERTRLDDSQQSVSVLWVSGHQTSAGRQWDAWNGRTGSDTREYLRAAVEATHLRPRNTVAAGVSMGAFSSMWLACNMPDLFDGAFAVAGVTNSPCPHAGTSLMMPGTVASRALQPLSEVWICGLHVLSPAQAHAQKPTSHPCTR